MRKRNLSEFMCIEMLYDYKSGKLDPLRHQAVEEGLQASPRVREELKKLSIGISYCDKLKNVSISEPLVDLILDHPKPTEKIFSKLRWSNFPQPVRWAMEAVVVAVAIALFVTQVPDLFKGEQKEPDSMLVKKFDIKPPGPKVEEETEISVDGGAKVADTKPTAVDPLDTKVPDQKPIETAKTETKPEIKAPIVASKEVPFFLRRPVEEVKPEPTTPVATTTTPVATPVATTPVATTPPAATTVAATPVEQAKPVPKKGNAYVYRMTMYVDDVDKVTPEIVMLVSGLGGEKAGEVELGWRRKGGSYFHFSIPQNNSPTLQDGLKKYAPFNMIKSSHPRVMPEGVERYILWVEKKNVGGVATPAPMEGADESGEPMTAPTGTAPVEDPAQGTDQEPNEAN